MQRYTPSRTYFTATAVALGMAAFSLWWATHWWLAAVPGILLLASAGVTFWLATRPAIELTPAGFRVGKREIAWNSLRRVDQTNWISPMVVYLTLADGTRLQLLYPGDPKQSAELLETIQRNARRALLNDIPHAQIFGEPAAGGNPALSPKPAPRYRLLTEEDEAEVERLYQKLKAAGRLDSDK